MTEKRDNTGALFKSTRKTTDSHPGYTGKCTIEGKEYYVSAWVKDGANGKFFSLSFSPKGSTDDKQKPVSAKQERFASDDKIPF